MPRRFTDICQDRITFFGDVKKPDLTSELADLDECLTEKSTASVLRRLQSLRSRVAGFGTVRVLNEDESGWAEIRRGWQLEELGFRSAFHRLAGGEFSRIALDKLALFLCTSVVIGETDVARRYLQTTLGSVEHGLGKDRDWKNAELGRFIFRLLGNHFELEVCEFPGGSKPGAFAALDKTWNEETRVQKTLKSLCTYHLHGTSSAGTKANGEFITMPYDVFPVELLAIKFIWEHQFGDSLTLQDPLFRDNPLANVPEHLPPVKDSFLQSFESALRKKLQPKLPRAKWKKTKAPSSTTRGRGSTTKRIR